MDLDRIRTRAQARRLGTYLGEHVRKGVCYATHDYNLANASGAAFRSDANDALSAVVTWNSHTADPATMFARMRHVNTSTGVVKRRNAANSAWIVESTDDETLVLTRSSNTMLDVSDISKTVRYTGSHTQTFDAVATLTGSWWVRVRIESGVTMVFDANASENIDGATTKTVIGPKTGFIFCDASALYTIGLDAGVFATGDALRDTSGNELVKFSPAASAVNEITVSNAATGNQPAISATGGDTNISLQISAQGTGDIRLGQATSAGVRLIADQPITDSSGNELVKFVKVASAVNELTISNAATGNEVVLSGTGSDSIVDLALVGKGATGRLRLLAAASGLNALIVAGDGVVTCPLGLGATYIGDTANAESTLGLTINQGAADDEILSLKSSDVAHGVTDVTETDTYGYFSKNHATDGGLTIEGFGEASAGIQIVGTNTTDNTAKTTSAIGAANIVGCKKSGTSRGAVGADGNILVIATPGAARFIFDTEGSAHADVEWTTFDKFDDVAVLEGLDMEMRRRQGDPIKDSFGKWVDESRDILQRERIFNFYGEGPRAMMNMTRMHMLEVGAIRQLGAGLKAAREKIAALEEGGLIRRCLRKLRQFFGLRLAR